MKRISKNSHKVDLLNSDGYVNRFVSSKTYPTVAKTLSLIQGNGLKHFKTGRVSHIGRIFVPPFIVKICFFCCVCVAGFARSLTLRSRGPLMLLWDRRFTSVGVGEAVSCTLEKLLTTGPERGG